MRQDTHFCTFEFRIATTRSGAIDVLTISRDKPRSIAGVYSVTRNLSVGHGEVAHLSDTTGGIPHTVAFASAVAQDLPGLHVRQGMFDAGTNTLWRVLRSVFLARQRAAMTGVRWGIITSGLP
jgi:hypothetical protein